MSRINKRLILLCNMFIFDNEMQNAILSPQNVIYKLIYVVHKENRVVHKETPIYKKKGTKFVSKHSTQIAIVIIINNREKYG